MAYDPPWENEHKQRCRFTSPILALAWEILPLGGTRGVGRGPGKGYEQTPVPDTLRRRLQVMGAGGDK